MRAHGEIHQLRLGVWRFTATPSDPDPAVTAALTCWPVAVISHASAAQHHGLTRVALPKEPEITVPHGEVHKLPGVKVHWSRDLPKSDTLLVGGVRYTTLARTGIDLADGDDPYETLAIVDDMVALGAARGWIHSRAKDLANGRGGVVIVRDATSRDGASEFRSWLERAASDLYRAGGLPEAEWNVPVYDGRGRIGVVDALWRPWAVISEKEGLRFHTTPTQRRRDANRFNRLQDANFRPRRFTWEDVVHRSHEVLEALYRALRAAGADLDPARIPRQVKPPPRPFLLKAG